MWTSLALLVLCAQAGPLAVTLDDRGVADAAVAALVAHGLEVVATDDARAPLYLDGRTRRTPVRSELLGPQLHRLDLTASLRLVRRRDGRVLATFELRGRGLGVSEAAAEQQAATEAVRGLAARVAQALAQDAELGATASPPAQPGPSSSRAVPEPAGVSAARRVAPRPRASTSAAADTEARPEFDGVRWRPGAGLVLTFEPALVVDASADPRTLRATLGHVRVERELAAPSAPSATYRVWLDARPLVASVFSTTVALGAHGEAARVPVVAALDLEVLAALRARGPAPLSVWLDGASQAVRAVSVDVLPLGAELVSLWRANHRLREGRTAEARALYREGLAVVGSRVQAELVFGAALAAWLGADQAGARALLADCLTAHAPRCEAWVDALARAPAGPLWLEHLRWSP